MPTQSMSSVPWCQPFRTSSTAFGVPLRETILTLPSSPRSRSASMLPCAVSSLYGISPTICGKSSSTLSVASRPPSATSPTLS